jgi:hypothetical protein
MRTAHPYFLALDNVNLRRIFFLSPRVVSVPRIIGIVPCFAANTSPVVCRGSRRHGLRVGPSQIIVFLFVDVVHTGVVPDWGCPWSTVKHIRHGISRRALRNVLFFVVIIPDRFDCTFGIWNAAGRGRISWTTTSSNTCRGSRLYIVLIRFEAALNLVTPVEMLILAKLRV